MLRLLVDFDRVRDGMVRGRLEDATGPRPLRVGDRVLLHDGGGHEAWGVVHALERDLAPVAIDWATWGPPRTREVQPLGWWTPPSRVHRAESPPRVIAGPRIPPRGVNSTGPKPPVASHR